MKTDVIISRATAADLEAIGELWEEFMDFHRDRDPHFARSVDGHERFKEYISGHIESDKSCVLIAVQGGKAVGYCLAMLARLPEVFKERDYGTIFDLAVTKRCRRSGIGEKLYQTVQSWFSERGIHRIELRVLVNNEAAMAFWKRMGFQPHIATVFKTI